MFAAARALSAVVVASLAASLAGCAAEPVEAVGTDDADLTLAGTPVRARVPYIPPTVMSTRPHLASYSPVVQVDPQHVKVVHLDGTNLCRSDTSGYTFDADVQVYARSSWPDAGAWQRLDRQVLSWSPSAITLQMGYASDPQRALVDHPGFFQVKVAVRDVAESNPLTVEVVPEAGAPAIASSYPASIAIDPSHVRGFCLRGTDLAAPTTTGYTFHDDVHVFARKIDAATSTWSELGFRNYTSWTPSELCFEMGFMSDPFAPWVQSPGTLQLKVITKGKESRVFQLPVE